MIEGILFMVLSAVLAGMSGFSACLGVLTCDPEICNRLISPFWYGTPMELLMSKGPKEIAVIAALCAVFSFCIGVTCLI